MTTDTRRAPGEVRDCIVSYLKSHKGDATVGEIHKAVEQELGAVARSSVRSYLQIGKGITRTGFGRYTWRG